MDQKLIERTALWRKLQHAFNNPKVSIIEILGAKGVGNVVTTDVEGHEDAEQRRQDKQGHVAVVGIPQAPVNKIARYGDQQCTE